MKSGNATKRRGLFAALVAVGLPGLALVTVAEPTATGATDPCAASEVARTIGSVAKQTGDYLDSHPETNQAMTAAFQGSAGPQSFGSLKSYLDEESQSRQRPAVAVAAADQSLNAVPAADHAVAGGGAGAGGPRWRCFVGTTGRWAAADAGESARGGGPAARAGAGEPRRLS